MQRLFKHEPIFDKEWKALGLSDDNLQRLQEHILQSPKSGTVIKGANGIRKLRWFGKSGGKRGGIRVFYIDFEEYEITYLLFVISKTDEDDLDKEMRKNLGRLVVKLKQKISGDARKL